MTDAEQVRTEEPENTIDGKPFTAENFVRSQYYMDKTADQYQGPVIAASPFLRSEGYIPCRVVIRDAGDQYIVHREMVPEKATQGAVGTWCYHYGYYFPKRDGNALADAWDVLYETYIKVRKYYV